MQRPEGADRRTYSEGEVVEVCEEGGNMVVADTTKYKYRFSLSFDGADEIAEQASLEVGWTIIDLKMEVHKHPSIEEFHTFAIQRKKQQLDDPNPIFPPRWTTFSRRQGS